MSRFFQNRAAGGFRLDSPVKVPVASEMPRCAPPHTNGAGEEACRGAPINNLSDRIALELVREFSSEHRVLLASKITKQGVYKSRGYSEWLSTVRCA